MPIKQRYSLRVARVNINEDIFVFLSENQLWFLKRFADLCRRNKQFITSLCQKEKPGYERKKEGLKGVTGNVWWLN